ncbi:nucleoside phosphorylase [Leucobacter luti]|uniref:Uridine phosphorylase n=1 Tax=Leucobacter luti TaxID=340320 RepID=A0A4R6RWJ2_9MICO|nr:nucleoside phosphorylase [Leucobacter luti]MCW2288130.1 uridine phosphorylase [Leucobacter luti]QYM75892.1 nucleoside phosphorylase [Leucobacter luti]TCK45708.1 uridine phosphorylase [Leucobacter luti]TDP91390.1 uridine phosphorylase [Leucobacter luti]
MITANEAWYLHCTPEQVGEDAIIVGDRGRVLLATELLDDAQLLNEDRGLTTATGTYKGRKITVSAFGMGAPIAAVVVEELASIGVRRVLRLGTVMTAGVSELGDLVVAHGAIRGEGTSLGYLPLEYPAVPDFELTAHAEAAARATGLPVRTGIYATADGFYTDLMRRGDPAGQAELYAERAAQHVVGTDMETSAVFVVARARGIAAASLCLASVDGRDFSKLDAEPRREAELQLLRAGLEALAA